MSRARLLLASALAGVVLLTPLGTAVAEDAGEPPGSPETTAPSPTTASPTPTATGSPAPNQPPVAAPDSATVEAGSAVTVEVLANDTDDGVTCAAEPPCLRIASVAGGGDRVTFTDHTVTFRARSGDDGTFLLTYVVTDGALTDTAEVTVQVSAPRARTVTISMADRPVALRRYTISGTARPSVAGRAVVRVQRRTPSGWVLHAKDATDAQGRYGVPFRTDRTGRRVFRAVAEWSSGASARSGTISRTVRAVADVAVSGPLTAGDVPWSWRAGCPVPPSQLRRIRINRLDYQGRIARGAVVVRAGEVGDIVKVLRAALDARFPIRSMKPADHYYDGGRRTPTESDKAAMRAGNTSAFNCRPVTGNPYRVSQHSYGNAIDVNTIENPYVTGSNVYPSGSREYLDRSPYRRGMILRDGVVASRMRSLGWLWGARWAHPDYQHFSSNGG